MSVRYEADHVWLITDQRNDQRLLSCCMNITWPEATLKESPESIPHSSVVLKSLNDVFAAVVKATSPINSRSAVLEGRFSGWISFPNNEKAQAAFDQIRENLHQNGLVVNQWTRDLIIPRQWK